jgi:hypothetical protein
VTISFWVHHPPEPSAFAAWDPDEEPARYASGVGHNVLELAKRLEQRGLPVAVGRDDLPRASLIVFLLKDAYSSAPALRRSLRAVQRARGRFAVIRSDSPRRWSFPITPSAEFVPTLTSLEQPWQSWLPPLPQRGLRRRRGSRRGEVSVLALKSNPENVPHVVTTAAWERSLRELGVQWWLDAPSRTDGSDQAWHDFSDVDLVLCAPHPQDDREVAWKPPTRLINAWVAGCIPLAAREPAYLELGREGVDTLFFDDLNECEDLIRRLIESPKLRLRMEQQVARRGLEFSSAATTGRWLDALRRTDEASCSAPLISRRALTIVEKRLAHLAHETRTRASRKAPRPRREGSL